MAETYEIRLINYEGKGKNRKEIVTIQKYARLSLDDMKQISQGDRIDFLSRQGAIKQVTVTSIKTWKTRPNDIRLGLKYGLYEYSYATIENGYYSGEILVKSVEEGNNG